MSSCVLKQAQTSQANGTRATKARPTSRTCRSRVLAASFRRADGRRRGPSGVGAVLCGGAACAVVTITEDRLPGSSPRSRFLRQGRQDAKSAKKRREDGG